MVAPIRMAPPSSTPGFTRLVNVHSLMDSDDEDMRYTFSLLIIIASRSALHHTFLSYWLCFRVTLRQPYEGR